VPVHHLEGHLLSPLLSIDPPTFPFVALLVSGGHTQLMRVAAVGDYALLGETLDDAAGEAFDKSAKLLGLPYPGGPALSRLAQEGKPGRFRLPRPMQKSRDLDFSFSGLKTAVMLAAKAPDFNAADRPDLARAVEEAIVDVLVSKALSALDDAGMDRLVVAGGVGANRLLRSTLNAAAARRGARVYYPEMELCTDNGAMIALVGALRLERRTATAPGEALSRGFTVKPRWDLASI
jgi:N6-L-threonylcarbamoyladenine synthase